MNVPQAVLAFLSFLLVSDITAIVLKYTCHPNGSITVINPDNETYISAYAKTSNNALNCTVTLEEAGTEIMVEDCPLNQNISLWLLQTQGLPTVLTGDISFNVIACHQIPGTGVHRKVIDDSWVTNVMVSTSIEPTVTARIVLDTHIEDENTGATKNTAVIGEPLIWAIDGPEGYIILPLNCTVMSGTRHYGVNLVLNGCSLDTFLLSHFAYVSETQKNAIEAHLYAFRFGDSNQVIIMCDMRGCPASSTHCDFSCPDKRKRSSSNQPFDGIMRSYPVMRQARDAHRTKHVASLLGQVSTELTVYSAEEFQLLNGSSHSGEKVTCTSLLILMGALSLIHVTSC